MTGLLTLNIGYDGERCGAWAQRRELIVRAIRDADADVVLLQAVVRAPGRLDQLAELQDRLPDWRATAFGGAASGGERRGSAILSRLPVPESGYSPLLVVPGTPDPSPRMLVWARVGSPGGEFWVFNAHFSWVPVQTVENVRESLELMQERRPAVFAGDFSADPGALPVEALRRGGWRDAWAALNPRQGGETFESPAPRLRSDYVWADPGLAPRLKGAALVGGRLSDHLGVLVRFE
jgi:endonuclease/exonuclease/phosphatase family metal-dependent hydrolase